MKKQRMIGIDIVKILCALFIFARHAVRMGGCHFYIFNNLIDDLVVALTGPIMTAFFMISGFSIQYVYGEKRLFEDGNIKTYFVKRVVSLLPMYLFVHIIGSFFYGHDLGTALRLLPIETLGIQTWFETLAGFLHNGGTWFVSCLLIGYFIYPQIGYILQHINIKLKIFILVILICIEFYSLYIIACYKLGDIYDSPIFRTVEFLIGVFLCSLQEYFKRAFNNWCYVAISIISVWSICYICLQKGRLTYFMCIPVCVLVYASSRITMRGEDELKNRVLKAGIAVINYASSLCYAFYILQCILWTPFYAIFDLSPIFEINRYRCMLAFGLLLAGTIVIHEIYEKPLKKLMNKCYNKFKSA